MTYEQSTYSDKDVQDDISWAAGWMYLATKQEDYLTENSKYTSSTNDWTKDYCYANASLGAAIINAEITGNWSYATSCIDSVVNANQNQYYVMNSWGSARHNTLMQTCALVVSHHKDESGKDYSEWAQKQMNYILGDNNANVCLVVGWNDVSATSPHHRAASNLTNSSDWHEYNSWDGDYASSGGHILYGALCGGPTSSDFTTYQKTAKDATSNEVALDYQVGLVGAAAGLYAAYGTGSVVAEIGPEVTVYASEVAAANGETPQPGTTTTEQTTTTTEETTTTTEESTVTTEKEKAEWADFPYYIMAGDDFSASISYTGSNPDFQWTSSDPNVLEVEGSGLNVTLHAKDGGTVTLTATNGSITLTKEIGIVTEVFTTSTTEETTTTTTTESVTTDSDETTATTSSSETTTTTKGGDVTPASLYGDVNLDGRVDIIDAVMLNKAAANTVQLSEQQRSNADCDANNEVDSNDAVVLLKFLVSIIKTLPEVAE